MFQSLRTSTKLILLCTLFIVSVAVTTYSLVVEKQIAISFARKELTGSKFLAALRPAYVTILTHKPFNPSASDVDTSAQEALETFATTQAEAASTLQIGKLLEVVSDSYTRPGSPSQVGETASALDLLAKMQHLSALAGDSSNLTLDTDLDTYYVQNIVVDQLPKLLGRLGELQIIPIQTSAKATSSSEDNVRLLVLDGMIKSTTDDIKNDLIAAYRGSADDTLKQAIESKFSSLFSVVDAYLLVRRAGSLDSDAAQSQHDWELVLNSASSAWTASQVQLDRLLQTRINKLLTGMGLSLSVTSALVALSIIIAIMTYRQIVRPLERLEKVASAVRETKNYDVRVNDMSNNEIGRVASAFDGMLAELAAARDRERLEQSELARVTRLTTMGVMAASVAHEINQPLTAIVSSGSAALRWLSNAAPDLTEVRMLLKNIVESGHRASQIIYSVRAMFKKEEHEKDWVDVNDLIDGVLVLVQSKIDKEAISLRTNLCRDIPPVLGGRTQLQQVLMNLIANAIEAMSAVTGRERVLGIKSEVDESASVLISVSDTGIGIDPPNLTRIFEAFFTTKSDGMGMGLSICRSIIEGYGGRLWASHGVTSGSVFFVALPMIEASLDATVSSSAVTEERTLAKGRSETPPLGSEGG
jgi:signal transduction histidine kinase